MDDFDETPRPRWRTVIEWTWPILAALVLFHAVGWLRAPSLPDVAPPVVLETTEGKPLSLEDYRGRTVVLNFWATWCAPCRLEAPSFAAFADANPDVVVLGLAEDRDVARVRRVAKELGITYPVASAPREVLSAYGVDTFPTTVIIDPDGSVRTAHVGILTRPQLWAMTR